MKYKAILFDMDGVIIDSEPLYWAHFRKALQSIGSDMSEEIFISQVGTASRESAPSLVKQLGLDISPQEYIQLIDPTPMFQAIASGKLDLHLVLGFRKLASAFSPMLSYAIATGSPPLFRETVRQKFGLDAYFSTYVSAEEVAAGKPAPDIYLEAARRLDIPISQCIVIDDAPAGVKAGKSAGAYVIAAPNKWTKHFSFNDAHIVCHSLEQVQQHISTLLLSH